MILHNQIHANAKVRKAKMTCRMNIVSIWSITGSLRFANVGMSFATNPLPHNPHQWPPGCFSVRTLVSGSQSVENPCSKAISETIWTIWVISTPHAILYSSSSQNTPHLLSRVHSIHLFQVYRTFHGHQLLIFHLLRSSWGLHQAHLTCLTSYWLEELVKKYNRFHISGTWCPRSNE